MGNPTRHSDCVSDVITDEAMLIDEVIGEIRALGQRIGAMPAGTSSDLESAASTTDGRRVALESVRLAVLSLGDVTGNDEEFDRRVMPRAERIRRWVLAVGDAD